MNNNNVIYLNFNTGMILDKPKNIQIEQKNKKTNFKFMHYSDPSHGWLRVPKYLVQDLLGLDLITKYSYENNDWLYLEEDQDATSFLTKLDQLSIKYSIKTSLSNKTSHIRNFKHIGENEDTNE